MTIVEVQHTKVVDFEPVLTVRDAKGETHQITFADGSGAQVMAGLVRCSLYIQRDEPNPKFPHGPVYALKDCQILTTQNGDHGIALRTTEGFDLAIVLDARMRQ